MKYLVEIFSLKNLRRNLKSPKERKMHESEKDACNETDKDTATVTLAKISPSSHRYKKLNIKKNVSNKYVLNISI